MSEEHFANGHMRPEDVTPEQEAMIRANWGRANEELDSLVRLSRAHREAGGCGDAGWCIGEHAIHELDEWAGSPESLQALLNAALTRLAEEPT